MQGKYKVITLCGSSKFKDDFKRVQNLLSLAGNIVLSPLFFNQSGNECIWEGMDEDTVHEKIKMLGDMHKRKIDMADEIFVINVSGYIGEATKSEIEYAIKTGKKVNYLEQK